MPVRRFWAHLGRSRKDKGIRVVCGRGRNPTLSVLRCPSVGTWPAVFSGQVDVLPSERRDVGQEFGRNLEAGFPPGEDRLAELQRVPVDDDRGQQVRVAPTFVLKYNIRAVRALGSARSDLASLDEVVEGGAGDVQYLGD